MSAMNFIVMRAAEPYDLERVIVIVMVALCFLFPAYFAWQSLKVSSGYGQGNHRSSNVAPTNFGIGRCGIVAINSHVRIGLSFLCRMPNWISLNVLPPVSDIALLITGQAQINRINRLLVTKDSRGEFPQLPVVPTIGAYPYGSDSVNIFIPRLNTNRTPPFFMLDGATCPAINRQPVNALPIFPESRKRLNLLALRAPLESWWRRWISFWHDDVIYRHISNCQVSHKVA